MQQLFKFTFLHVVCIGLYLLARTGFFYLDFLHYRNLAVLHTLSITEKLIYDYLKVAESRQRTR